MSTFTSTAHVVLAREVERGGAWLLAMVGLFAAVLALVARIALG